MNIGLAIITFVCGYIFLKSVADPATQESALWFWTFLLAVGVYLIN
jgi:hypothetical protein